MNSIQTLLLFFANALTRLRLASSAAMWSSGKAGLSAFLAADLDGGFVSVLENVYCLPFLPGILDLDMDLLKTKYHMHL